MSDLVDILEEFQPVRASRTGQRGEEETWKRLAENTKSLHGRLGRYDIHDLAPVVSRLEAGHDMRAVLRDIAEREEGGGDSEVRGPGPGPKAGKGRRTRRQSTRVKMRTDLTSWETGNKKRRSRELRVGLVGYFCSARHTIIMPVLYM